MDTPKDKVSGPRTARPKARKPFVVNSKEALKTYRHTPAIYGEMKYARKFVSTFFSYHFYIDVFSLTLSQPKQTLSFFDLPAELRVKVYHYAFRFEEPIDFLPQTDSQNHDYWVRKDCHAYFRRLLNQRRLNLSFLRTCRAVQSEGSEVFYGENEFRFSNVNGHMVANLFIHKIYKQHFMFITQLTIPMPFPTRNREHPNSIRTRDNFRASLPTQSWLDNGTRINYVPTFEHLVWNLNRIEKFKKLVLVLHWDTSFEVAHYLKDAGGYGVSESDDNRAIWRAFTNLIEAKPELQVDIVRIHQKPETEVGVFDTEAEALQAYLQSYSMSLESAYLVRKMKCSVKDCTVKAAWEHRRGMWEIIEDVPEDVLLPAEENEVED
ncbi:hypothetical protein N0V83_009577 [Neocucurbitaria cava]|uniref:DUF7730 domain-containing protein n=1 Tax=Neocucurbitaria cava TaxID=798079 RepID=A0A9W8Y024_9PLEO|nr:hypothetical protein N0V83_009577 [Neocucurbitaria cava]